MQALDAVAARRWADLSVAALAEDRDAIDRINVYPVADGDTGTNLLQTMRSAVAAVESAAPDSLGGVFGALARGALAGARGNSGMLLSQVLRGIAEEVRDAADMDGHSLLSALVRADDLARQAMAEPVNGTILSVLHAAAQAAETCDSAHLGDVVHEVTAASMRALDETTAQLSVLADAGVVDAGGRGLVILLDSLYAVVHEGQRLASDAPTGGRVTPVQNHDSRYAYEVMYLLSETDAERAHGLREELPHIGDCVSVVGDGAGSWAVHVHCDDIGAAIESGIGTGRVHQIQVTRFADQVLPTATPAAGTETGGQVVLACVHGAGLAELFRGEGAEVLPIRPDRSLGADDLVAAITETAAASVVLLPNDDTVTPLAEEAAGRAVRSGLDVVVVPTASPVQGLAALAVHDPSRRTADDTVAMAEAAAATRRGELIFAGGEALTWVGRCQPGDVLGLADGDVVLIRSDLVTAACELADRMLAAGGELVTAFLDAETPEGLAEELAAHLRRTHPEIELACYPGGELAAPLLLGVE